MNGLITVVKKSSGATVGKNYDVEKRKKEVSSEETETRSIRTNS